MSGRQVTQSLLCRRSQKSFCERDGAKETKKLMAEAFPTIQTETKPTIAEEARRRAGKCEQPNVASVFSLRRKGHGQAKLFIN